MSVTKVPLRAEDPTADADVLDLLIFSPGTIPAGVLTAGRRG